MNNVELLLYILFLSWLYGDFGCQMYGAVGFFFGIGVIFSLGLIILDGYIVIFGNTVMFY